MPVSLKFREQCTCSDNVTAPEVDMMIMNTPVCTQCGLSYSFFGSKDTYQSSMVKYLKIGDVVDIYKNEKDENPSRGHIIKQLEPTPNVFGEDALLVTGISGYIAARCIARSDTEPGRDHIMDFLLSGKVLFSLSEFLKEKHGLDIKMTEVYKVVEIIR